MSKLELFIHSDKVASKWIYLTLAALIIVFSSRNQIFWNSFLFFQFLLDDTCNFFCWISNAIIRIKAILNNFFDWTRKVLYVFLDVGVIVSINFTFVTFYISIITALIVNALPLEDADIKHTQRVDVCCMVIV